MDSIRQFSNLRIFFFSFILLFSQIYINAQTTYYVSSSKGNDSNSGKSESSPWKTILKINNSTFTAGDKILFKRGDTWQQGTGLVVKNSKIQLGSYGTGNRPIITLVSEVTGWNNSSNWSKANSNYVWKMKFPNFKPSWHRMIRLFLDGIEYPRAKDLTSDNLDNLTPGQTKTYGVNSKHRYWHSSYSDTPFLYVWTDGTNPALFYKKMEYSGVYGSTYPIYYTVELKDADYVILDNLDIRGGMSSSVGLGGSDNIIIKNCNIGNYTNHFGIDADTKRASDKTSDYVEISNCTLDTQRKVKVNFYDGTVEYGIRAGNGASGWKIHHSYFKNWNFGFLTVSNLGACEAHHFYNNEVTAPDIESCKPVQLGGTGTITVDRNHEIYNNYFHDIKTNVQITASNNNKFYFNIFKDFTKAENEHYGSNNSGFGIVLSGNASGNYIFNNTFYQNSNRGIMDWTSANTFVYNNLIVNTNLNSSFPYQVESNANNKFQYKNNLLSHYKLSSSSKIIKLTNNTHYTVDEFNKLNGTNGKVVTGNEWMASLTNKTINSITIPISTKKGIDISSLIPSGFKDRNGILVNRTSPTIGAVSSSSSASLTIKVFLQAPFDEVGSMNSTLKASEKVPLMQSYNQSPWNYDGGEYVRNIPADVVDWVLVELRSDTSSASMVSKRAAFIKSDGTIVDIDGNNLVSFTDINEGSYYIIIRHRNHLGIMSADKITIGEIPSSYDFTTSPSKAFGNDLADLGNNEYGMYAGDADGNGVINNNDYSIIENQLFQNGYKDGDLDLDGKVNVLDYIKTNQNLQKTSKIP